MARRILWVMLAGILMATVVMEGCSSVKQTLGLEGEPPPPPSPRYYDFPDVLVPSELDLKADESVIYEFGGIKAGLLRLSGRVEVESLTSFFREYMPKDGWTLVNSVKFSRILLNFAKADRTCQIYIRETTLTTEVDLWVHPLRSRET